MYVYYDINVFFLSFKMVDCLDLVILVLEVINIVIMVSNVDNDDIIIIEFILKDDLSDEMVVNVEIGLVVILSMIIIFNENEFLIVKEKFINF